MAKLSGLSRNLPLTPEEEKRLFVHPQQMKPSSKGCMLSLGLLGFPQFHCSLSHVKEAGQTE